MKLRIFITKQLLFSLLCGLPCIAYSNNDERYYPFRKYSQKEGLSSYNIKKVIEDPYGFIWIATQSGLNRFDGRSFIVYDKSSPNPASRIVENDITDIVIDKQRNLAWVSSATGGLNAVDLSTSKVQISVPLTGRNLILTSDWILSMQLIGDDIWLATNNGLSVYNIRKNITTHQCIIPFRKMQMENFVINRLLRLNEELMVASVENFGLVFYSIVTKEIVYKYNLDKTGYNPGSMFDIVQNPKGGVFISTKNGLAKIMLDPKAGMNKIAIVYASDYLFLSGTKMSSIGFDKNGTLWFSNDAGLFIADKENRKVITVKSSRLAAEIDKENRITDIFFDNSDNVWLSSMQGVMVSANKISPFISYSSFNNGTLKINHTYGISPFSDGSPVYICTERGLYLSDRALKTASCFDKATAYYSSFFLNTKVPFFCTSGGLKILSNNKMADPSLFYPELKGIEKERFGAVINVDDSLIYLASYIDKGLWIWDHKKSSVTYLLPQDASDSNVTMQINSLYVDKAKNVWLTCNQAIFVCMQGKGLKRMTIHNNKDYKKHSLFFDMCEIRGGYMVASYGEGLLILDSEFNLKKQLTVLNGLSNNGVYNLYPVSDTMVIVSSNSGISRINTANYQVNTYTEEDGLVSNSLEFNFNPRSNPWPFLNSIYGFTIVEPRYFSTSQTIPKIYISEIKIAAEDNIRDIKDLDLLKVSISNTTIQTTVYFSGVNYSNPQRTVYQYRIKELHSKWIELGNNNFVQLVGLNPGRYHLQVKAANEDGVWSEPKELILTFLPKWYQTWWFKILVFFATAGIVYAFYRYRIAQIKKQHEIRKNIATDLHDDLGSTLNSVKVFTNLAISGVKQEESLQQIKENLTEATMSLRDMIWVLDDSLDTVDELVTRLKQFALPVAAASNMEAVIKADSEVNSIKLTKEEKRNLFLVCKEAINNSIKYSGATQINVNIKPAGKKIQVTITDNGKGFNVDEVKKGYGLKNMQYRAGQVKYKAVTSSEQGKGTVVDIKPV